MRKETAEKLEQEHNVYVDPESEMYNREGRNALYGWETIPKDWRAETMTLSQESQQIITGLKDEGHNNQAIKAAMEDGAYLGEAGISQEIAEEIHAFLS